MVRGILQAVLVALLALAGAAATQWKIGLPLYAYMERPADDEITVVDFASTPEAYLVIDARNKKRYEAGHIPDAILLNEANFDEAMFELFPKLQDNDRRLVIYCDQRSCKASRTIAEKLRSLGLINVFVLRGGWKEWVKRRGN